MSAQSVFRYHLPEGEAPSEGVVKTIATLEDCDPRSLDPSLYTVIDPDALDAVFGSVDHRGGTRNRIEFEYCGYLVTIQSDGVIRARAPTPKTSEKPA